MSGIQTSAAAGPSARLPGDRHRNTPDPLRPRLALPRTDRGVHRRQAALGRGLRTKLVVWAGDDGQINVLDAYCRHMGGDLSQGQIRDGNVACPFHGWKWKGQRPLRGMPYAKRSPNSPRPAPGRRWSATARYSSTTIPRATRRPRKSSSRTGRGRFGHLDRVDVESHGDRGLNCREIIDNVVDMAHFFYVHYALPDYFKECLRG